MTDVMAQSSLGLNAPASRQDIVSALLNDYGNSFGRGEISPSTYSPVPALKELPPPPRGDSLDYNKPLPAVQRMSMKFQLRGKLESFLEAPLQEVEASVMGIHHVGQPTSIHFHSSP